ncbi:zeta toxin family protein [Chitinimonas taiwanensis]|uniref:zeta toxin family protein n=1 Tax=Chitinimonas taiwanensis TaxID=240412 RepID=UPI0035B4F187
MSKLNHAIENVLNSQRSSNKPLAIILAGHNGSGKSTMWYKHLADKLQVPLINADRMMLSILPEPMEDGKITAWAGEIRDNDQSWMKVAQKGVEAFVAQAMVNKVPFAMETVFSHWVEQSDGSFNSKIQLINQMQENGYFVLLIFVGLSSAQLSIARVSTRVAMGGHNVSIEKLNGRFPRTQQAIKNAISVADAAILADNSQEADKAFTVCRIQLRDEVAYDLRNNTRLAPQVIREWLDIVSPLDSQK